ncbi:MAG TPA: phosphoribosylanthranilate isomerase [Kiritimatiellia bacterium]|nr:phosphoribosylanthranilate isomerase [Kiritimatiellia bacterium]
MFLPHVKICGITRRQDALLCAEAGVGALGAVFYAKSPRCIEPAVARKLFEGLDPQIARVGIFVNASVDFMVRTARIAALDVVQMHGEETTETIEAVRREGFHVVQALKRTGPELLAVARALPPRVGILVECGRGALPGGNGLAWNWSKAAPLAPFRAFAIAGGLNPQNLATVARDSRAAGFDASSGVEISPGIKDEAAVRAFLRAARDLPPAPHPFSWKGAP